MPSISTAPQTEFWVRNLVRKPNTFWLQTAQDKFHPDFVVRLKDGRTLVVEYKGKNIAQLDSEQDKRIVGETWAEASGGTCLFAMPVAHNFAAIDRAIAGGSMAATGMVLTLGLNLAPEDAQAVTSRLADFEAMTWDQILDTGSHRIALARLCKAAQERLAAIGQDDLDELVSFRVTGVRRVWCIQDGPIMRVLWWDPEHKVYPVEKDKADRKKRKRRG